MSVKRAKCGQTIYGKTIYGISFDSISKKRQQSYMLYEDNILLFSLQPRIVDYQRQGFSLIGHNLADLRPSALRRNSCFYLVPHERQLYIIGSGYRFLLFIQFLTKDLRCATSRFQFNGPKNLENTVVRTLNISKDYAYIVIL